MGLRPAQSSFVCRSCLRALDRSKAFPPRSFSSQTSNVEQPKKDARVSKDAPRVPKHDGPAASPEPGPMARRLEEATEEALLTGGTAGRRAIEDAGFSDELKAKLLNKIADANFKEQYSGAFTQSGLSSSAGEGTRHIAHSQAWTGEEPTADAVLRMLDDAKKPLKPGLRGKYEPPPVDMRLKKEPARSPGQRAVSARDRAALYSGMGMKEKEGLSDEEREAMRKEFKDRFEPAARAVPNTIAGLTALANQRIEDAIARGQFKNIPRGKAIERDARADNPFIDTTEYIMNKMIQRQDLVPPWIEKQQDLAKAANVFRARLRSDWTRHAARTIAAAGGSLEEQVRRAEDYAAAEMIHNPRLRSTDQIPVPANTTEDPVMVKMRQQVQTTADAKATAATASSASASDEAEAQAPLLSRPFRDPAWEKTEQAYMELSVANLNSITRSYNLMAPDLAKKPYFSLQRELDACYADVAPRLAREIRERATRPRSAGLASWAAPEKKAAGILEHLGAKDTVRIHLERQDKAYGLKEWWRDLWKK